LACALREKNLGFHPEYDVPPGGKNAPLGEKRCSSDDYGF